MDDLKKIRALICCSCGAETRGRQWWKRDYGYGLCLSCADKLAVTESARAMKQRYGVRGTHYAVNEEKGVNEPTAPG